MGLIAGDLFERLLDQHPDAWSVLELQGDKIAVVVANAVQARRLQMSVEQLLSTDLRGVVSEEQYAAGLAALRAVQASGKGGTFEIDGTPGGGAVQMTILPLQSDKGASCQFIVQVRDETERRAAARALVRSEARLSMALDSAELYLWSLDCAAGRVDVDPRWAARLGYQPGHFSSAERTREMLHPQDRPQTLATFGEHFAGRTAKIFVTCRHLAHDGTWRWVEMHGMLTERDAKGQPKTAIGVCRDVTESRRLEQRVAAAERMASLGTLAAGVAHEINNPLTYVSTNLAMIEEALESSVDNREDFERTLASLRLMVRDARDGASRIARIVRDLKTLSRGDGVESAEVDVVAVLGRCLLLADHEIRHKARVVREFSAVPRVFTDEGKLMQIALNLLMNAAQSIPEGDIESNLLRVALRTQGSSLLIEISDTGSGMTPDVAANLFDPFFTTKFSTGGTGLGLAICRSLAGDLGGTIDFDTAPGVGSTFRVSLPLNASPAQATVVPTPIAATSRPLRVLVIDDEAAVGRLIQRILHGHDVVVETLAARALERLRAGEHFDSVLCDVMMPGMSGVDFHELLSVENAALASRVVFMTGGAFSERATSFLSTLTNLVLNKPFDPAQVRAFVAKSARGEQGD
ncbi:MAG: ATP-binding protein [Polyangiaceae bacterium]